MFALKQNQTTTFRRTQMRRFFAAIAFLICSLNNAVASVVIDPSQTVRVNLSFSGNPFPQADLLLFQFMNGWAAPGFDPTATYKATLMDGNKVLGTDMTSLVPGGPFLFDAGRRQFSFAAATSPWTFDDPAVVDFTPYFSRSDSLYVLLTSDKSYAFQDQQINLLFQMDELVSSAPQYALHISSSTDYIYASSYSVSSSAAARIPEPGSLALLGLGLAGLAAIRKRNQT
jgi:hypothetical protein